MPALLIHYSFIICSDTSLPQTIMSLQDILLDTATSVLETHMRPKRRVHLQTRGATRPLLPPPPIHVPVEANWPKEFQTTIDAALATVWAPGTIKTYTSAINKFLAFCQDHQIPSEQAFPASDYLLCAFIASQPPHTSKNTIKNYLTGIRAWHVRNGYSFSRSACLNLLATASRPLSKPNPPRPPVTIDMLLALASKLNLTDCFDACVFACVTSAFWGLAQLGELLPTSYSFDHKLPPFPLVKHAKQAQLRSMTISLPWTKVHKWTGEIIYLAQQDGPSNPVYALLNHLALNVSPPDNLLFSYRHNGGFNLLLKHDFMSRCNDIWSSSEITASRATGHSFRIGGTTHLLLCGIHPDIIKKTG